MSILEDGTIKFNCDLCFTNYTTFEPTGEKMSVAPEESGYNVWTSGKFIKFFEDRARRTMDGLYGDEVREIQIESYRMCWYVFRCTRGSLSANRYSQGCVNSNARLLGHPAPSLPQPLPCHWRIIPWVEIPASHRGLRGGNDGGKVAEGIC